MEICRTCKLPRDRHSFAGTEGCVVAQAEATVKLLNLVGTPGVCRGCEASVFWVRHLNGANTPYDPSGLNHFVSCPKSADFKRKTKSA